METTPRSQPSQKLPVAVIGAGPVGLAAAAHLIGRGEEPLVLESGPAVGANILEWAHVRIFSPWSYNVDDASAALLEAQGWLRPDPAEHPTGGELVERYLAPLAATPELAPRIRLGSRVEAVGRLGFDKMKTVGRDGAPFVLQIRRQDGGEEAVLARAVIDASGTWSKPNPLGAGGLPALGEKAAADRIFYGIPDVLGLYRERYAGRTVMVVGSGHSAFNALLDLARLAKEEPGTQVVWAVRRPSLEKIFGGGEHDQLAARGLLGQHVRKALGSDAVRLLTSFKIQEIVRQGEGLVVIGEDGRSERVDEIVAATGFRPDLELLRELRLDLDPAVESPAVLAPMIDPNVHSCGTVRPHGFEELKHPEKDFYVVGMKSYGRAPTFLLRTGYEQVRSVVAALAGDLAAAREVRLVLPETGVCSGGSLPGVAAAAACCAPLVTTIGAKAASCC
ncbi:MAG TPA: NAD(P)-binding domain-containing protein, partial [Thermoanaerobaculia bacterium]|nr:NAD(P)-binding domain-containing protein [Thermoanaerobaculia bacterium]